MGSYKHSLIAASSFFLILDAFVVAARVYVRIRLVRAFGCDDALLCLSFFGYFMACVMGFVSIHYGFAADSGEHQAYFDSVEMDKFYWANQLCLYLSSGIVKIAVALVLYRLAINVRNRVILVISIVVVVVWTTITTLFSSDICAANPTGTTNYVGSKMCSNVGYFRMISNIFIDYFYALFPIIMVWNAGLTREMKVVVCGLLGLGILASAATIAKLVILVKLQTATGFHQDWLHYQLLEWAGVELGLAIFAASTAALRPLLRRLNGHSLPDVTKTDTSATAAATTTAGIGAGTGTTQAAGSDTFHQGPHLKYDVERPGGESTGFTNTSEQYELRTFNSREPTIKVEDEEMGELSSTKQARSTTG